MRDNTTELSKQLKRGEHLSGESDLSFKVLNQLENGDPEKEIFGQDSFLFRNKISV